ncbi:MAG TPA: hypothetical protein ENI89_01770 [Desulfobulbus sp.]|nr:hypothetical protein [Desulfobulbus sp.]
MNTVSLSELPLPDCLSAFCCFLVLALLLLSGGLADALAAGEVTFSWRANPPEDNVIGYRLYYGTTSRFDSAGRPRPGFHYDRFIDFTEWERCEGGDPQLCQALAAGEVVCENLWSDTPRCTLSGLTGPLYFAMTAYNAQSESSYTREIFLPPPTASAPATPGTSLPPAPGQVSPAIAHTLQQIYSLLLLRD